MSISVVAATYGDWKWQTMSDRAVLSTYDQNAHEVIAHHEPDGTVTTSRNAAAQQTTGDWLCFLDADDELAPGYIATMLLAISHNDERTLLTPAVQTVRPGRTPGVPSFFREVPLRQANWLVVGTLIHRDLFFEVGGFHEAEHGYEDWGLWSKCARVGATVVKVPGAVYRYHVSPNSMHRVLWRDKARQRASHARVAAELDEWEKARV